MRIWIAVFLLLLFATQGFPVAAWGQSYAKSQIAATLDGADDDDSSSLPKEGKAKKQNTLSEEDYDHSHFHPSASGIYMADRQTDLHSHEYLYGLYSGEVTTPPPNRC